MRRFVRWAVVGLSALGMASAASAQVTVVDLLEGAAGARLGESLACTGGGFVVGAPAVAVSGANLPGATAAAGSASVVTITGIVPSTQPLSPSNARGGFGYAVTYLGTANPEYVVGAPFQNGNDGVVYRFGGSFLELQALQSPRSGATFGFSLAELDPTAAPNALVVGAPGLAIPGDTGSVYVFDSGAAVPSATHLGPTADGRFGFAVTSVPDLSGDGLRDIAVSAPITGTVTLLGARAPVGSPALGTIGSPSANLFFGAVLVGNGELTGDPGRVDDLLIGSPGNTAAEPGRVELHAGEGLRADPRGNNLVCRIRGETQAFGASVAALGDIDGDGAPEFAVGAPDDLDRSGNRRGRVFVYGYTAPTAPIADRCTLKRSFAGDLNRSIAELGRSLAGGPRCDLRRDGDRQFDFVAGAEGVPTSDKTGKVVAFLVPTATPTPAPTATPDGATPTIANTSFLIKRDGELVGAVELDRRPPSGGCNVRLHARIVADEFRSSVVLVEEFRMTERSQAVRARNLPTVAKIDGTVPAAYLIAEVSCGPTRFFSNIFGRFVNCGTDTVVRAGEWLQTLARRLEPATNTQELLDRYGERMRKQVLVRGKPHMDGSGR